jgi:translation initiation factor 3 subunit L
MHSLYKMLGYFSLIGLLRLHSLLGDFFQALKVLDHIQLNKKNIFNRVPACQVTTYYYLGFAYMVMRRYADAIRTFSNILLYIQRTRNMFQAKNYQNDLINKQTEQMYILLSICMALHPQLIDESLMQVLREKPHSERMSKMQRGDLAEFENSFAFACPKFLSPLPPVFDAPQANFDKEPLQLQLKVFRDEVQQQLYIGTIRSYLKLYTTMPVSKLANFLEMDEEDLKDNLLCFKHKMRNLVTTKNCTSALDGEFQSGSEVDFYIDGDMVHVADTKVSRRYGDFFIRQIHKFEELNRNLKALPFC